ncbi:MAG: hypothetical protein PHR40_02670 [Bacteroidales bacterium]|nr:hypothetical protein [Bacteroidales bacterium]
MSEFSLSANEKIITRYPWYNLGYLDIYEYICTEDQGSSNTYLEKAALRVYSRKKLYNTYKSVTENRDEVLPETPDEVPAEVPAEAPAEVPTEVPAELPAELPNQTLVTSVKEEEIVLDQITDFVPDSMPRFVLAGGDYFTRKDFEQVELDRTKPLDNFIAEKPSLLRSLVKGKKADPLQVNEIDASELFDDASFYTETLASIYTEQGFYKRALDVYAKLILLYPEKSSYFASLVKELKRKHKI